MGIVQDFEGRKKSWIFFLWFFWKETRTQGQKKRDSMIEEKPLDEVKNKYGFVLTLAREGNRNWGSDMFYGFWGRLDPNWFPKGSFSFPPYYGFRSAIDIMNWHRATALCQIQRTISMTGFSSRTNVLRAALTFALRPISFETMPDAGLEKSLQKVVSLFFVETIVCISSFS